jgi:hypothetical protein
MAVILSLYGAKIEATRRSLPAREVGAAIRALMDEQRAAMKALAERRHGAAAARQERTHELPRAGGEGLQQARPPPARGL